MLAAIFASRLEPSAGGVVVKRGRHSTRLSTWASKMIVNISEDAFVITQRQTDGHQYVVANGRVFSHRRDAERVYSTMTAAFDAQVAAGKAGTWRPELRALKWA